MKRSQTLKSTEASLRERIKELSCLYSFAQLTSRDDLTHDEVLQHLVEILPPAWQYPEITSARITLDGNEYLSDGFEDSAASQCADLVVQGVSRGAVEVFYRQPMPECDEGPFLKEERNLIDIFAGEMALLIERWEMEAYRAELQNQLRHADRLATVGLLAAGVAHEINEPLGAILGFAQLAKKHEGIPAQTRQDLEKIEAASLHAREIIRNLLVFARQVKPKKQKVCLNAIVNDSCSFFQSRCAKEGVEMTCRLSPTDPEIIADPTQMSQVLVNLFVNALQAMPNGGSLVLGTEVSGDQVSLTVEDTGCGMRQGVLDKIFVPFFTTKDVGQGTGLGLPVVHGIVTANGGRIEVTSRLGEGTRFTVHLPLARAEVLDEGVSE